MGVLNAAKKFLTGESDIDIYIADRDFESNILFTFPVLPNEFRISSPYGTRTVETLTGELLLLGTRKIKNIGWSSFFPDKFYDFIKVEPSLTSVVSNLSSVAGALLDDYNCWDYVRLMEDYRDTDKVLRLIIQGASVDVNVLAVVDKFDYRVGADGDCYYDINFKEFRKIETGGLF